MFCSLGEVVQSFSGMRRLKLRKAARQRRSVRGTDFCLTDPMTCQDWFVSPVLYSKKLRTKTSPYSPLPHRAKQLIFCSVQPLPDNSVNCVDGSAIFCRIHLLFRRGYAMAMWTFSCRRRTVMSARTRVQSSDESATSLHSPGSKLSCTDACYRLGTSLRRNGIATVNRRSEARTARLTAMSNRELILPRDPERPRCLVTVTARGMELSVDYREKYMYSIEYLPVRRKQSY